MVPVLVVDDDCDICSIIALALEPLGVPVLAASSCAQALALCREHRPGLILLDAVLPGEGSPCLAQIRAQPALKDLPVVAMSGDPLRAEALKAQGAVAVLPKPFALRDLRRMVRQWTLPLPPAEEP